MIRYCLLTYLQITLLTTFIAVNQISQWSRVCQISIYGRLLVFMKQPVNHYSTCSNMSVSKRFKEQGQGDQRLSKYDSVTWHLQKKFFSLSPLHLCCILSLYCKCSSLQITTGKQYTRKALLCSYPLHTCSSLVSIVELTFINTKVRVWVWLRPWPMILQLKIKQAFNSLYSSAQKC
jgi:hypothetical protein